MSWGSDNECARREGSIRGERKDGSRYPGHRFGDPRTDLSPLPT